MGALSATAASSAGVGWAKSCRGVTRTPALRRRATAWIETIESPPRAKKLSWGPTRGSRSTSAHSSQIKASTPSRGTAAGAGCSAAGGPAGSGSARRSSLPLGESGRRSSVTTSAGSMYSGSRARSAARSAGPSAGVPPVAT
jgi:hypothetical protein